MLDIDCESALTIELQPFNVPAGNNQAAKQLKQPRDY